MFQRAFITLILAATWTSLSAADRPFDEKRAQKVLDDFVTEYKVYATCLSLLPDSLPVVYSSWKLQFQQAKESMSQIKPTKLFLARFLMAESTTLVDDNMTLGDARKLCDANNKAVYRFETFGFTKLSSALLEAR